MKKLDLKDRLIIAADFKPSPSSRNPANEVYSQVIQLAKSLRETGVILKVNSALRTCGYSLIADIQLYGLKVFADLKLSDIPATLETDGELLARYNPELLTVMCSTGIESMRGLKRSLTSTEVLGVTVLTSIKERDSTLHGKSIADCVTGYAYDA
ncbi:MAG: orotidine 5'-phosphate decarboxylase / HUMPS family protein, partial [Patescibacteria group bacterium]